MQLKSLLLKALSTRAVQRALRPTVRRVASIFMLHRFSDPELGVSGHSPDDLRRDFALLRREGYNIVPLADLFSSPEVQRPRTIAFTIDDGYRDFRSVALPLFEEFDCPVSIFVSTAVIDGDLWYWWDKVAYAFANTSRRDCLTLDIGGVHRRHELQTTEMRRIAGLDLIEQLKYLLESDRVKCIAEVCRLLEADIPTRMPERYQTLSWDDLSACATSGLVTFGPHTVTHPVLPSTSYEQARREIEQSWTRLREKCSVSIPILCYPFGAYSQREVDILATTDLIGACTTEPRYARPHSLATNLEAAFTVPRFAYPGNALDFLQIITGFERLKTALRGAYRIGGASSLARAAGPRGLKREDEIPG